MTASAPPVALLDAPATVRLALSPLRRALLARLRQPASATGLAAELSIGRQRVNYHMRALEAAGLVTLAETRQKRGCTERILVATARAFVVDPGVVAGPASTSRAAAQDRFASEHLIGAAAELVRDVSRMQRAADTANRRLLTFTMKTEVSLAAPEDLERFSAALAEAVARTTARFNTPRGGRRYRVVVGGHPAPRPSGSAHA